MRVLHESVALEEAKKAKAAAQIQAVAKVSGIVEKYALYHKGIVYGKQQTLKEIQRQKLEDMVEETTGEPEDLGEDSHEKLLKYVSNLNPQAGDAFLRVINQIQEGGSQAMHPDPDAFFSTVSAVHKDEPDRVELSKGMQTSSKRDRETIVPNFKDVEASNAADAELMTKSGKAKK